MYNIYKVVIYGIRRCTSTQGGETTSSTVILSLFYLWRTFDLFDVSFFAFSNSTRTIIKI